MEGVIVPIKQTKVTVYSPLEHPLHSISNGSNVASITQTLICLIVVAPGDTKHLRRQERKQGKRPTLTLTTPTTSTDIFDMPRANIHASKRLKRLGLLANDTQLIAFYSLSCR